MLTTTLSAIRDKRPCKEGWEQLLAHLGKTAADDDELNLTVVLDSNGVEDTLWVLSRVFGSEGRKLCVTFAADCAERVLPLFEAKHPGDKRPRRAIEAARSAQSSYADAIAAADAVTDAADAATDAAHNAAYSAYRACCAAALKETASFDAWLGRAVDAAYAAALASGDPVGREWQKEHFRKLVENT